VPEKVKKAAAVDTRMMRAMRRAPRAAGHANEKSGRCAAHALARAHCAASGPARSAPVRRAHRPAAPAAKPPTAAHPPSPCPRPAPGRAAWGGPHRPAAQYGPGPARRHWPGAGGRTAATGASRQSRGSVMMFIIGTGKVLADTPPT